MQLWVGGVNGYVFLTHECSHAPHPKFMRELFLEMFPKEMSTSNERGVTPEQIIGKINFGLGFVDKILIDPQPINADQNKPAK
jgi:hypothetical protein